MKNLMAMVFGTLLRNFMGHENPNPMKNE